jgi:uncharacterized membrane protein YiaA
MNYDKWTPSMKASVCLSFWLMIVSIIVFLLVNYPYVIFLIIIVFFLVGMWKALKQYFEFNP